MLCRCHVLKCWPEFFKPMVMGLKTFDVRVDDRDYQVGDVLLEREFAPRGEFDGIFTLREAWFKVVYLVHLHDVPRLAGTKFATVDKHSVAVLGLQSLAGHEVSLVTKPNGETLANVLPV